MAAPRFTPGPWSVEDPMDFELAIVEANKPTHEWRFIATCRLPDGDDDQAFTGREIHANARLIAASPRLFAALEPFAAALEGYDSSGPDAWADDDPIADTHFTVGQLREAAAALTEAGAA